MSCNQGSDLGKAIYCIKSNELFLQLILAAGGKPGRYAQFGELQKEGVCVSDSQRTWHVVDSKQALFCMRQMNLGQSAFKGEAARF